MRAKALKTRNVLATRRWFHAVHTPRFRYHRARLRPGAAIAAAEQKIACKSIPAAAAEAFKAAYPKAVVKDCSKEIDKGKVAYEFSSDEGKTHRDVSYSDDGKLIAAEETVSVETVPDAVKTALKTKYPKGAVTLSREDYR